MARRSWRSAVDPGKVAAQHGLAQGGVTFSQRRIERDRGRGCFVSRGRAFGKRQDSKAAEPVVVSRDAGISERIVWIERDRLVITDDCAGKTVFGKRVPVKPCRADRLRELADCSCRAWRAGCVHRPSGAA